MMLPRMHDSPMPMKTTSGFDSDTATAPTEELVICPSVTGIQFSPPSVVFQRPPPTAPKYASRGRPLTPLTAIERPPRSGPRLRQRSDEVSGRSAAACELGGCCAEDVKVAAAAIVSDNRANRRVRIMERLRENGRGNSMSRERG